MAIRRGDMVTVYEDPFTKQKIEGRARVLRIEFKQGPGEYRCLVRFVSHLGEGPFSRLIVEHED